MSTLLERLRRFRRNRLPSIDGIYRPIAGGAPQPEVVPQFHLSSGGLPVTPDDYLVIHTYRSDTNHQLWVNFLILDESGDILRYSDRLRVSSVGTWDTFEYQLVDGILLYAGVSVNDNIKQEGLVWASLGLQYRATGDPYFTAVLAEGYVKARRGIGYPGGRHEGFRDGPGYVRYVSGTNPAIGSQATITVPAGRIWRVLSCRATLSTSASVANREVRFRQNQGGGFVFIAPAVHTQPENTTYIYTWVSGGRTDQVMYNVNPVIVPDVVYLKGGDVVQTEVLNWQAGDDWSAIEMTVEEWLYE